MKLPYLINDLRFCSVICDKEFQTQVSKVFSLFNENKKIRLTMVEDFEFIFQGVVTLQPWVIGISLGEDILILNPKNWKQDASLGQLIIHETVHILTNRVSKSEMPLWVYEGIAVYLANQYGIRNIDGIDLDSVGYESDNFYPIAGSAIAKMVDEIGIDEMIKRIRDWSKNEEEYAVL